MCSGLCSVQLPIEPTQPFDQVEMSVSAQDGKGVLPAERRNPNVVGRDRGTSLFELTTKLGVPDCGFLTDLKHVADAAPHVWLPDHREGFEESDAVFAVSDLDKAVGSGKASRN